MPNQWSLNLSKYGISDDGYQEMKYFCRQYDHKKTELALLHNSQFILRPTTYDGMPHGTNPGDPTAEAGERAAKLSTDCEMIEQTAIQTDSGIYQWLIDAVTHGFSYLQMRARGIPCGERYFSKRRREFFLILAVKKGIL